MWSTAWKVSDTFLIVFWLILA